MVKILPPPPTMLPTPEFFTLRSGSVFYRIFDPDRFESRAAEFRCVGPISRFDHHRFDPGAPGLDTERGVIYAGFSLSCCVVEVFGDTKTIIVGAFQIAGFETKRQMKILDLRRDKAMKAGSVAAIAKDARFAISQQWSRFFYENAFLYGQVDGLIYGNAHNDEDSLVLFERAQGKFEVLECEKLSANVFRDTLLSIGKTYRLAVSSY